MATDNIRHDLELVDRLRNVMRHRSARLGEHVTLRDVTDPVLAAALPDLEAEEGIKQ